MRPIDSRDDSASDTHRAAAARYLRLLARHPERDIETRAGKWARALARAVRRIGRRSAGKSRDGDRPHISAK